MGIENITKLIKSEKFGDNGQYEIDFDSTEKLLEVLKKIKEKYPLIKEIIENRISYDGENFILDKKKMNEDELMGMMLKLNDFELNKLKNNVKVPKYDNGYEDSDSYDIYERFKKHH